MAQPQSRDRFWASQDGGIHDAQRHHSGGRLCGARPRRAGAAGAGQRERPLHFSPVPDGMLRLDTRTGAVSICAKKDASWACTSVPDERQALENEIARLQRENGALKKDMLARGLPLPGGVASAPLGESARAQSESAAAERCRDRSRDERIREDVAPPRRHDAEDAEQRQNLGRVALQEFLHPRHGLRALREVDAHEAVAGARIERKLRDAAGREPARRHEQ